MNVRHWSKTERDSLERALLLLEENKPKEALPFFETILNHHPAEDFLKYSYARCALYSDDKQNDGIKRLYEVYEKNRKTPDIQYYMAVAAWYNGSFDEAQTHIAAYLANRKINPQAKVRAEELKKHITYARYYYTHPGKAKVYNLGSAFNGTLGELSPATDAGATLLIYFAERAVSGYSTGTVLRSARQEGELESPVNVDEWGTSNIESISLSHDAMSALLSIRLPDGSSDIYLSHFDGNKFSTPQKLKGDINSSFNENSASVSANGQQVYFSSNRPGGRGAYDLYVAYRMPDSSWSAVKNLGDSVNTDRDETNPFLHADGKTLFFSSAGHNSMGGLDVCKATFRASDSTFRNTQNLGYPVNSPHNEFGFVMSANGENAYFASNRKDTRGRTDVYHCEPNLKGFKPSLCLLKGKILRNNQPCLATIEVQRLGKNAAFTGDFKSNPVTGDYLVALPTGSEYQLQYKLNNYNTKSTIVDLADMVGFVEKTKNMHFDALFDSIKPSVKPPPTSTLQTIATVATQTAVASTPSAAAVAHTSEINVTSTVSNLGRAENQVTRPDEKTKPAERQVQTATDTILSNRVLTVGTHSPVAQLGTDSAATGLATATPVGISTTVAIGSSTTAEVTNVSLSVQKSDVKRSEDIKTNTLSVQAAAAPTAATVGQTETRPPVQKPVSIPTKTTETAEKYSWNSDAFEPVNAAQEKMMANAYRYGNIGLDSLEFRVQISAFKNNMHYYFPKLEKFGKIEKVELGDGYKRLMLGGSFKTYGRAFAYAKKIIKAGYDDVYIVVLYKGYRYSVEDLEDIGVFK